ncbi:MAG: glycosyltransferase [Acidimicrobiia bacterium]|nr:glycosyltransferase [Acidimicrobiia bacterium]
MRADQPTTVAFTLPDLDIGGGQTILLRTLVALREVQSELVPVVVALRDGPMLGRYEEAGIPCHVLGLPHGKASLSGHPATVASMVRILGRERVQAICSLNTPLDRAYAQLAGEIRRVPVAVWFMSVAIPLLGFPPPRGRELAWAKRLALYPWNWCSIRRTAARLALSASVTASFADHLRLAGADFDLVPPGLPDAFYRSALGPEQAATLRRSLGVQGRRPLLLCVGMLIDLKGQQELVPMMGLLRQRLPEAHLLLVGEGPNRAMLEQLVEAEGVADRVTLLGHRGDVADLLAVSDGLISASRSEGFGMAVLEAMAAGKPVVAVHTPAFEEFAVGGETAIFVERQDAALLAGTVADVFAEPERAAAMGRTGRERAERFRVERTAERLAAVLQRMLEERRASALATR